MHSKPLFAAAIGALLMAGWPTSSSAAPQATAYPPLPQASLPQTPNRPPGTEKPRRARASLRMDVGQAKPWVGQAVPVTVTAFFRDVESVTLEGAVQLASKGIMTSELARAPRQTTEIVDGEPTFVVKWSGTFTPSSPGPLGLSVELPVRIKYRDAAPRTVVREEAPDDPFAGFGADPFDSSFFDRMRNHMRQQMQMFEQPRGRVHEEPVALKAASRDIDVLALPTANQPPSFSGAVGRFDLKASLSSAHAHVSEPLTLRITVEGAGDLDRVDLPGVAASDTWKAYPPKVTREAVGGKLERKVFEQLLIPLHGGDLTVPPVSFTAFDPAAGKYVTRETAPLNVSVDGTAVAEPVSPSASAGGAASAVPATGETPTTQANLPKTTPWEIGVRMVPVAVIILAVSLYRVLGRRRAERSLRRNMKRAALAGSVGPFFDSAHRLIETRLASRWGVPLEEVTAQKIRDRLGPKGDPLAEVLATDEALRFARAGMDGADLKTLCRSVEQSLRGAS